MSPHDPSSDINISRIPVSGAAGLGLVVMAAAVASGLPQMRWLAIGSLVGGTAIGLSLIAARNRGARKGAAIGATILLLAVVVGLFLYLRIR
jgi:hypothetical protein